MALKARNMLFASTLAIFSTALAASAHAQSGIASVYSGERTANGEYAHASRLTAAHRSLVILFALSLSTASCAAFQPW